MKKYILAMCALSAIAAGAKTYNYITIDLGDRVVSYPVNRVGKISFTEDDLSAEADYTLRYLTFEDADCKNTNYLGNDDWTSLVDSPQYGGPQLYGPDGYENSPYFWYDENNTELFAAVDPAGEGNVYWSGGEAVSNYVNSNYATETIDYTQQLASPHGGHNGSANFCVHNGYFDGVSYGVPSGGIEFADGVARTIDHMYVSLSAYQLSSGILGTAFSPAASATDWVKFIAIGTDADGNTKQVEITMCENGKFITDWVRWDLAELGDIVRLDFNITSSMTGTYGMTFPGYLLYDDIAVRFPKE